jgi:hypothetical protein
MFPVLETWRGLEVVVQSWASLGAERSGPPYTCGKTGVRDEGLEVQVLRVMEDTVKWWWWTES